MSQTIQNKDFLQSLEWKKFQKLVGKKVFSTVGNYFKINIIEHKLPVVGKYFYVPRGLTFKNENTKIEKIEELIALAKKNKAGWIRVDLAKKNDFEFFKKNIKNEIVKAPHDMQPRQIFKIDILKSEEDLLSEMKPKTRYNIRLAIKKGVQINKYSSVDDGFNEVMTIFLNILKDTNKRKGIKSHKDEYYEKMLESISSDKIKLYVAEYKNEIIAVNIIIFYKNTATYLHGATSNNYRNVMAPFLLQWQAILDAKEGGYTVYDFGGVKTGEKNSSWEGITRFKLSFSKNMGTFDFLGSYDIIMNPFQYAIYQILQRIKSIII